MLSKYHRILTRHLSPPITTARCSNVFINPFCMVVNSPELPPWAMFSDNPTPSSHDDDFVFPSLAHWVHSNILQTKPKLLFEKPSSSLEEEIHFQKITTFLLKEQRRHSSPSHHHVAQALHDSGFWVSNSLVMKVLKRFGNDCVLAFGFFIWAKKQTPYVHSPQHYNLMVDILGKAKEFDLMSKLLKEMKGFEGYVSSDTMTKVIRRFGKAQSHQEAVEAFRGMGEYGVVKDSIALNKLLDALVKGQSIEIAHNVLDEFKTSVPLSSLSFNILINGWCKVRNFEKARKVMEDMKEHGFEPNVFTYNNFVESYCHDKDFCKVDQVFEEMRENGCPPNAVTYTILLLGYGKVRQWSKALEEYERMKKDGIVPDTPFYSSLMYILGKAGRLKDAWEVFEDMPKQGVVRDVLTYNTIISIACAHSKEETALRLLKEMEETSCKPDLQTYHPLLTMCCKKKRMKVLKFLLDHMFKNDLSPDQGTYTLLLQSLSNSRKLVEACMFFEEMVSKGFTPTETTIKLLMRKLEIKSMLKEKDHIEELIAGHVLGEQNV